MAIRKFLAGIDDRVVRSIRGVPDLKPELRLQAREHELHRLESVAEMLCLVALMTRQGVLAGRETILVGPAKKQFGRGERGAAVQAAHCLPGQLTFGGKAMDDTLDLSASAVANKGLKPVPLAAKLRHLSARTDLTDTLVNQADSSVEKMAGGKGLKPVFGEAAGQIVRDPRLGPSASWPQVRRIVLEAVASYRQSAALCFQVRVAALANRNGPALLGQPPSDDQYKAAVILEYMRVTLSRSVVPEPLNPSAFRLLLRDVVTKA